MTTAHLEQAARAAYDVFLGDDSVDGMKSVARAVLEQVSAWMRDPNTMVAGLNVADKIFRRDFGLDGETGGA